MPSQLSTKIMLSTDELEPLLESPNVLPVFVGSASAFSQAHIPGSVNIEPSSLVCGIAPAAGKIPDSKDLSTLFSAIGLSDNRIIIAYDDEGGGWAGRLIWTLDILNHKNYHYLDGGITAWIAEGYQHETGSANPIKSTPYNATIDQTQIVSADDIKNQLGDQSFAIWDARSAQEHSGEKVLAAKGGRIPGAVNIDWLDLMDRNNYLRLKPLGVISSMLENKNLTANKTIVTHCHSHHRSGLTYITGKILDLNIRGYDGSWSEWGNLTDTPTESDV